MKTIVIDCADVGSEMALWEKYIAVTLPEGAKYFGYSLPAFNDAITGGGPGWPGECDIYFTNTSRIQQFRGGEFYRSLQRIADDSTSARIHLEELEVQCEKPLWLIRVGTAALERITGWRKL